MGLSIRLLISDPDAARKLTDQVLRPEGFVVLSEGEKPEAWCDVLVVDPEHPEAAQVDRCFAHAVVAWLRRFDEEGWRQAVSLGALEVLPASWTLEEARQVFQRVAGRVKRRKAAWQRWREQWLQEQPWLKLFHQLPVGLLVLSLTGVVLWVNGTAARWLDCRKEKEGWACAACPPVVRQFVEQARQHPSGVEGEVVLPESGRVLSTLAVPGEQGEVLLFLQDVSSLKTMEAQRAQLMQNISLQLRSPLTAILGYAELLGHVGPLNEAQQQFVERIVQSVHTTVDVVEKLLEITRIESGMDTAWEVIPLAALLNYTVEAMRPKAEAKGVHFEAHFSETLPAVQGPPARLRYVFDHLVSDAIRYTPPGGKVVLEAQVAEEQAIVRVSDTGVGIPQEEIPRIFEKFYRATNVATRFAGSGLGLSLVHTIVTQVGGRIWVESEEGKGTTFTVVLPVAPVQPTPVASIPEQSRGK